MPAFSSARSIASTVLAFNAAPFSNRLTVCADTPATLASLRLLHPKTARAIQH
jgi:hypothetical protein